MKKSFLTLFLCLSLATTMFAANVIAASVNDVPDLDQTDFEGDVVDNPWGDLFRPSNTSSNIALNKKVSASGSETNDFTPEKATDGNEGSRWSSNYDDNAWITVDLGNSYSINKVVLKWEAAFGEAYSIQVSTDGSRWTTVKTLTNQDGGEDTITFNAVNARYVKMQGMKRALPYGFSLWEIEVYTSGSGSTGDIIGTQYGLVSKGKKVTASGVENNDYPEHYAVDGNEGTRWSSNYADNAWIIIDLEKSYTIDKVVLNWEAAYGEAYNIEVSLDGNNWTVVSSLIAQDGGEDTINFSAVNARYVKLQGVKRALPYGYSLWEMNVYGK